MRFVLTDYQEVATADVAKYLRRSTRDFVEDGDYSAVSLTAPTGAGKTVIATAVIERLFFGDDEVEADPEATVLWITDQPSLNEQTKRKMLMASTMLKPAHLITIEEGFDQEALDPGRVYFLNIQKLGRATSFVKTGDIRDWSVWQTIANTVKVRGGHFYLVIDEAHRGTGSADKARPTIVARMISDPDRVVPPMPIVWGISATPERFNEAMAAAANPARTTRNVSVAADDVRASGLLKDVLDIRHPDEAQPSDATLTRLAANNIKDMTDAWAKYAEEQNEPLVKPVLVVQVRTQASDTHLWEILTTLSDAWPALHGRAIAHSFESHTTLDVNGRTVRYLAPEDIQDDADVRVVLFKQALTTGWDCPRAETLLSFYKAQDYTYIAQLIGRMVRTPLARRIATDEILNSVSLYLPNYDEENVQQVVDRLRQDPNTPPVTITRNSITCTINSNVPKAAVECLRTLPTYVVPGRAHKSQVARLRILATRLAGDGIVDKAIDISDAHLIETIERERKRLANSGSLDALIAGLGTIDVGRTTVSLTTGDQKRVQEHAAVDARDINSLFGNAKRSFRDGLANRYWSWLMDNQPEETEDDFLPDDAKILVSALAQDPATVEAVENAAMELVKNWLHQHSAAIANLSEAAKTAYQAVRALAKNSELSTITLPNSILVTTEDDMKKWSSHIYGTATNGKAYPAKLNTWEAEVVETELSRGAVAWYRNPTGGDRTIRVPYKSPEGWDRPMYPDFIFFHDTEEGIKASIVDPHNYALGDTGPKWRGLAAFAEKHGEQFLRIDAVIKTEEHLLRLDLKDPTIRQSLATASSKDEIMAVFTQHGGAY